MRVLLDTNIIIYREDRAHDNYSIGHLFRWLNKLKFDKIVHPFSIDELQKYKDEYKKEEMDIKLDSYNKLMSIKEPDHDFLLKLNNFSNKGNDIVDNYLLYEVTLGRVDILITEDNKMHSKARVLGISDRVYTINAFLSKVSIEFPNLVEYKVLSVKKEIIGNIDHTNSFFDSFRENYSEFDEWILKKCDEEAYVSYGDNVILGFLFLKIENQDEIDREIVPILPKGKKLKIRSFKVESSGFRLGERFMYIIFDNALANKVDFIYVTLFDNKKELETLISLLKKWGFEEHGYKDTPNGKEIVLVKNTIMYNFTKNPRYNYPLINRNQHKFILPISSRYHTKLFPDAILTTEKAENIIKDEPQQYAIQKVYISWAKSYFPNVNPGDIILIYRMDSSDYKNYKSALTSICILQEVIKTFKNHEDFLQHCENRSVFSRFELDTFWSNNKNNLAVIKLLYFKTLNKKVILNELRSLGVVDQFSGPRTFHQLSEKEFENILQISQTVI